MLLRLVSRSSPSLEVIYQFTSAPKVVGSKLGMGYPISFTVQCLIRRDALWGGNRSDLFGVSGVGGDAPLGNAPAKFRHEQMISGVQWEAVYVNCRQLSHNLTNWQVGHLDSEGNLEMTSCVSPQATRCN